MALFDRLNQWPPLRADMPKRGDPAAGTVQSVHGLQPGVEQGVALPERPNRFLVKLGVHVTQDKPRSFKNSCQRKFCSALPNRQLIAPECPQAPWRTASAASAPLADLGCRPVPCRKCFRTCLMAEESHGGFPQVGGDDRRRAWPWPPNQSASSTALPISAVPLRPPNSIGLMPPA
jgi:hypothetical protein